VQATPVAMENGELADTAAIQAEMPALGQHSTGGLVFGKPVREKASERWGAEEGEEGVG